MKSAQRMGSLTQGQVGDVDGGKEQFLLFQLLDCKVSVEVKVVVIVVNVKLQARSCYCVIS